jgi:DNA-binding transcriptional LysR family regulator
MVSRTNLDIDVLRTFVAGMDLGSFARAADQVGRSQSAVSSQLRKLEEKVGCALVRKSGRGLVLTGAGESLMAYARRILDLNDEAVAAIRGAELAGSARLGLPEDFAEGWLPDLLGRFVRSHPKARVEVQAGRNSALEALVAQGALDACLLWGARENEGLERLADLPMRWIGDGALVREAIDAGQPLPLVVFQGPCLFRDQAVRALDDAGIAWRVAFSSTSLASLWSAAAAGLGLTVRSEIGMPATLTPLEPEAVRLPVLPEISLALWSAERPGNAAASSLVDHVREMVCARARELIEQPRGRRPRR